MINQAIDNRNITNLLPGQRVAQFFSSKLRVLEGRLFKNKIKTLEDPWNSTQLSTVGNYRASFFISSSQLYLPLANPSLVHPFTES